MSYRVLVFVLGVKGLCERITYIVTGSFSQYDTCLDSSDERKSILHTSPMQCMLDTLYTQFPGRTTPVVPTSVEKI